MSVAMTNCGAAGWVTDRSGYRYNGRGSLKSGKPWPALPAIFAELARTAAAKAGYADFTPDACLINRYEPGAKMSLHQDKNERDMSQPIVSVSLGLPALFLFGGLRRNDRAKRIPLDHGDVVVWGGPSRLFFHGVNTLADGVSSVVGTPADQSDFPARAVSTACPNMSSPLPLEIVRDTSGVAFFPGSGLSLNLPVISTISISMPTIALTMSAI